MVCPLRPSGPASPWPMVLRCASNRRGFVAAHRTSSSGVRPRSSAGTAHRPPRLICRPTIRPHPLMLRVRPVKPHCYFVLPPSSRMGCTPTPCASPARPWPVLVVCRQTQRRHLPVRSAVGRPVPPHNCSCLWRSPVTGPVPLRDGRAPSLPTQRWDPARTPPYPASNRSRGGRHPQRSARHLQSALQEAARAAMRESTWSALR
mmetsp:Transcript_24161/g.70794  ORF Transcript_24161/g.70794 Transcript_24161/m.70794 type:complete len:204 (+) Transcript_24161:275-886(+)